MSPPTRRDVIRLSALSFLCLSLQLRLIANQSVSLLSKVMRSLGTYSCNGFVHVRLPKLGVIGPMT